MTYPDTAMAFARKCFADGTAPTIGPRVGDIRVVTFADGTALEFHHVELLLTLMAVNSVTSAGANALPTAPD